MEVLQVVQRAEAATTHKHRKRSELHPKKTDMQIKIFTIPVVDCDSETDSMNLFLRSHKVVDVRKELVSVCNSAFWTFSITYLPKDEFSLNGQRNVKEKVDYKNLLSPEAFERFMQLRTVRREVSGADDVPPFVVFTDAELAKIAELEEITPQSMIKIQGIGAKRVGKYGVRICDGLKQLLSESNETSESVDAENIGD